MVVMAYVVIHNGAENADGRRRKLRLTLETTGHLRLWCAFSFVERNKAEYFNIDSYCVYNL